MDIRTLRAQRNNDINKLTAALEGEGTKSSIGDDRFWKPERDKAGNATATIRFLPNVGDDELPWVKIFQHAFKGPTGRWYIENCLSTIGQEDPVMQVNRKLWNSTTDDNSPARKQAREQKRKLSYTSNIIVVDDPKHPEFNGKTYLFRYGKKIFDKIMDKAKPTFEDEKPVNVFDYWEGANFKLRMKQVDGYPNYDSSTFEAPTPVGDDEEIVRIANSQYKLKELVDASKFKSYAELETRLKGALYDESTSVDSSEKPKEAKSMDAPSTKVAASKLDDDDDIANYFKDVNLDD